jgi:hypothetical protein
MMRESLSKAALFLVSWCVALCVAGCVTTPLPIPPTLTVDVNQIDLGRDDRGGVEIIGRPGAIDPGGEDVRMTSGSDIDSAEPEFDEFTVNDDGSFQTWLRGDPSNIFFIEHIWTSEDIFVTAIFGFSEVDGPDVPYEALIADPGADSDGDGSPDAIDCAPLDETLSGRRCP